MYSTYICWELADTHEWGTHQHRQTTTHYIRIQLLHTLRIRISDSFNIQVVSVPCGRLSLIRVFSLAAHISRVFLFFGRIGYSDSSWRVSDGRRFGRPSCVTCLRSKGAKWAVLSGLYGCLYIEFSKLVGYEIKQVQEPFQFCIWLSGCWQYITKDVYF